MFLALTGSVWMGGAGVIILGGLYWKRGTAYGAWSALITGVSLAVIFFIGMNYWTSWIYPFLENHPLLLSWLTRIIEGASDPFRPFIDWHVTGEEFPINGQECYFITMISSVLIYIVVSILTCRKPFNMERMLHRGAYRKEDSVEITKPPRSFKAFIQTLLGIDSQFSKGDKIISWAVFLYGWGWLSCWAGVVLWSLLKEGGWPEQWWANWYFYSEVVLVFVTQSVATVWFCIGGTLDLRHMFKLLAIRKRNVLDDGRVIGHVSADDVSMVEKIEGIHIDQAHQTEKGVEDSRKKQGE